MALQPDPPSHRLISAVSTHNHLVEIGPTHVKKVARGRQVALVEMMLPDKLADFRLERLDVPQFPRRRPRRPSIQRVGDFRVSTLRHDGRVQVVPPGRQEGGPGGHGPVRVRLDDDRVHAQVVERNELRGGRRRPLQLPRDGIEPIRVVVVVVVGIVSVKLVVVSVLVVWVVWVVLVVYPVINTTIIIIIIIATAAQRLHPHPPTPHEQTQLPVQHLLVLPIPDRLPPSPPPQTRRNLQKPTTLQYQLDHVLPTHLLQLPPRRHLWPQLLPRRPPFRLYIHRRHDPRRPKQPINPPERRLPTTQVQQPGRRGQREGERDGVDRGDDGRHQRNQMLNGMMMMVGMIGRRGGIFVILLLIVLVILVILVIVRHDHVLDLEQKVFPQRLLPVVVPPVRQHIIPRTQHVVHNPNRLHLHPPSPLPTRPTHIRIHLIPHKPLPTPLQRPRYPIHRMPPTQRRY